MPTASLDLLEERLGHRFRDQELLVEALTHRSLRNECAASRDSERLEFFGDAVLGLFISRMLMEHFPEAREGELSRRRAGLVGEETLAELAQGLGLGGLLRLGRGEEASGGRQRRSLLADAFEAVVGALYLDGGEAAAEALVQRLFADRLTSGQPAGEDWKSALQEQLQKLGSPPPVYRLLATRGPEHALTFVMAVEVGGRDVAAGEGTTKKEAQQQAARQALQWLATAGESP